MEEGLLYTGSENKGADQLRGNREADLRLCFRICIFFFIMRLINKNDTRGSIPKLGPVVQNIINLTTSLRHRPVKLMVTK